MRRKIPVWIAVAATVWLNVALAQSIKTDGDVETDGQLTSNVVTGTPPLAVSSMTMVPNLNADQVDGIDANEFALDADLQNVETMLMALQTQVEALGTAPVEDTGQNMCWDADGNVIACSGTGQDGDLQAGVAWPTPRFTDNWNGTVTDNLTGLIWLKDADCFGKRNFTNALSDANGLMSGTCGLTDSSLPTDWRLPNVKELSSLIDFAEFSPALPRAHPFSNPQSSQYWSSSSDVSTPSLAWGVGLLKGSVFLANKADLNDIWPVRGGQ